MLKERRRVSRTRAQKISWMVLYSQVKSNFKKVLFFFILLGLISTNHKIRLLAVECLGLFCIQDTEVAAVQHLPLFLQVTAFQLFCLFMNIFVRSAAAIRKNCKLSL